MTNSSYRRSYIGNQHAIITQRRVAGEFAETITKYLLLLTIVMSGAVRAWGQTISVPANDNFSGRLLLNGYTNRVTGSTTGATAEPGEPRQAAQAAQATVWLSWTAPQAGIVTIDTQGSDYDTQIAVFTGTSLDTLTPLIANDDFPGQTWSKVSFPAAPDAAIAATTARRVGAGKQPCQAIQARATRRQHAAGRHRSCARHQCAATRRCSRWAELPGSPQTAFACRTQRFTARPGAGANPAASPACYCATSRTGGPSQARARIQPRPTRGENAACFRPGPATSAPAAFREPRPVEVFAAVSPGEQPRAA